MKIYRFGDDNIWKRYINEKLINILFYGIRRPLFDSYSTRTNTTTNQKQSAKMEDRRERRRGHGDVKIYRFGGDIIWKRCINEKLINLLFYGIRRPLFDKD